MPLSLIVHAGAWDIPDDEVAAHTDACRRALTAGWRILQSGGAALDAAQAAVLVLEDDPALDAGIGSVLKADGTVELDAGIMRGADLKCGAVATVKRIQNPITLARHVMESPYVLLTGAGAEAFGVSGGMSLVDPGIFVVERERRRYADWQAGRLKVSEFGDLLHDTVGAVAMDAQGHIVAAVSTGGTSFTPPGRVGDVPLVGCGYYADDMLGGAVSTGHGESIARVVLAKTALDFIQLGASAQVAAETAVEMLRQRVNGVGGIIVIDHNGGTGLAHSTSRLAHGFIRDGMAEPVFGV